MSAKGGGVGFLKIKKNAYNVPKQLEYAKIFCEVFARVSIKSIDNTVIFVA